MKRRQGRFFSVGIEAEREGDGAQREREGVWGRVHFGAVDLFYGSELKFETVDLFHVLSIFKILIRIWLFLLKCF